MSATGYQATVIVSSEDARHWHEPWWPLLALTFLAGVLRLSTLDLQSFWGDEAFTPVHLLHPSLWATLREIGRTENTPPLWYLLEWADFRVLGDGEVALRLPSALAGIAAVPVAWAIGRELSGRRAAVACAAFVAVNPLFVWYSQEARSYGLFVLTAALAMLSFVRAQREPTRGRMAVFALAGSLALLTHYFAVFLLMPMVLWLLWEPRTRRAALGATGTIVLVGAALIPLIHAQLAHNRVQWIGEWPLSSRLREIPRNYLAGYYAGGLGNKGEPLVALPVLAGLGLGLWRMRRRPQNLRAALVPLTLAACGILLPIMLVAVGEDFLAPRNLIGAMIPLTALIAVIVVWPGTGRTGIALALVICLAFLAVSLDVNRDVSLQREDWRGLSNALAQGSGNRAITALYGFGSTPLEYYMGFHLLAKSGSVAVTEIDETGDITVHSPPPPPAPGFRLLGRVRAGGLVAYRFVSAVPRRLSEATLAGAGRAMTLGRTDVLVPAPGPARVARR
ncbi:MAG: mannosyltransferase [Solirubrobacteraceae bacterium]|nr:mannosyltransferase [Solirubrobacteraceae bacterium]